MRDEELKRIIGELDSALEVLRQNRGEEFDHGDAKLSAQLTELRRDLAVYRAISQTQAKERLK